MIIISVFITKTNVIFTSSDIDIDYCKCNHFALNPVVHKLIINTLNAQVFFTPNYDYTTQHLDLSHTCSQLKLHMNNNE